MAHVSLLLLAAGPALQAIVTGAAYYERDRGSPLLFLLIFLVGLFLPTAILGLINRKLIRRMSQHFARETQLRIAVHDYLRARAAEAGAPPAMETELGAMVALHNQAMMKERARSVYWSWVVALPVIRWYFFWFITGWTHSHEQRWFAFTAAATAAANKLGLPLAAPAPEPVKKRPFPLYVFLTFITGSLFLVWWYHVLIRDPNTHFRNHLLVEDAVVRAFA